MNNDFKLLVNQSSLSVLGLLGGLGSCTSDFFCFFFDSLRTKMQMGGTQGLPKYKSVLDCILWTYNQNGLTSFFKGINAALLRQFPDAFVRLYTFEAIKRHFEKSEQDEFKSHLIAGSFAGFAGCIIGNPLELIKVRLINDINREKYQGIMDCVIQTYKVAGLQGFCKGMTLNLPRAIIWNGVDLSVYQIYKKLFNDIGICQYSSTNHVISGALAGFTGTLVISPIEVVKTRQIRGYNQKIRQKVYQSPFECALDVLKRHGPKGFYMGFIPFTLTYTPWSFVFFGCYEKYQQILLPLIYRQQ